MDPTYETFPDLPGAEAALSRVVDEAKGNSTLLLDAHYPLAGMRRAAIIARNPGDEYLYDLLFPQGREKEVTLRGRPLPEGTGDLIRDILEKGKMP